MGDTMPVFRTGGITITPPDEVPDPMLDSRTGLIMALFVGLFVLR